MAVVPRDLIAHAGAVQERPIRLLMVNARATEFGTGIGQYTRPADGVAGGRRHRRRAARVGGLGCPGRARGAGASGRGRAGPRSRPVPDARLRPQPVAASARPAPAVGGDGARSEPLRPLHRARHAAADAPPEPSHLHKRLRTAVHPAVGAMDPVARVRRAARQQHSRRAAAGRPRRGRSSRSAGSTGGKASTR